MGGQTFDERSEVTFPNDEAARHKVIDFTGDLGLLSLSGQGGIPIGHLVAWNANHTLQIKFCVHLWKEILCSRDEFVLLNPQKIQPKSLPNHTKKYSIGKNCDEKFTHTAEQNEDFEEGALLLVKNAFEDEELSKDF